MAEEVSRDMKQRERSSSLRSKSSQIPSFNRLEGDYEGSAEFYTGESSCSDSDSEDLDFIMENQYPMQSDRNGLTVRLPMNSEKSIEVLHQLNCRIKAMSFSSSANEQIYSEHIWKNMMDDDSDNLVAFLKFYYNETLTSDQEERKLQADMKEKLLDATPVDIDKFPEAGFTDYSSSYEQICEFKDALKDAITKLKLGTMDQFEFNVPRFTTFNSCSDSDDEEVEKYFDFDHEYDDQLFDEKPHFIEDGVTEKTTGLQADDALNKTPRRLTSVVPVPKKTPKKSEIDVLADFSNLSLKTPKKSHIMETRQDSAIKNQPLELRTRKVSRMSTFPEKSEFEDLPRKRKHSLRTTEPEKYVCMAEAVERFHKATPARFHTKPRNEIFIRNMKARAEQKCTIPISPHLKVAQRSRPNHALSRKELEDIEVEEMKKHQVKARPINDKIFKPPSIDSSHRSLQVTEFKPFNLTEFKKKVEEPRPTVVKFTARPVPKGLFKKSDIKNTSAPSLSMIRYDVPARMRVPVKSKEKENKIIHKPIRKGPVTTLPFSFDERDMMLLKKKEKRIKDQLEEERKMHDFHANPVPKFPEKPFQEKATIFPTIQQPFYLSADNKGKANKERWEKKVEEEKMLMKKAAEFKAKPPVVLSRKPFVPLKTEHECKMLDVHLWSEIRAKERALYDLKIQTKQKAIEEIKMQRQKELEEMEEQELARLRREMVHKANPIRHYKEVTIQPANKALTLPLSPKSFRQ